MFFNMLFIVESTNSSIWHIFGKDIVNVTVHCRINVI